MLDLPTKKNRVLIGKSCSVGEVVINPLSLVFAEGEKPRIVHADGGAFVEPPHYKFHNAYFSVLDDDGTLLHFAKDIGDLWSGVAEYESIKWAVENIKERPLVVYNDCITAMAWAKKGSKPKSKFRIAPLNLFGVSLVYKHNNLADKWNAENHSKKHSKAYYYQRWKESRV